MKKSYNKRKKAAIVLLIFLFAGIVLLFWRSEWIYSLPTPVPTDYKAVSMGAYIDESWKSGVNDSRPVFLHFFNPDCPCSRFNVPYFKSLVKQYSSEVNFAIVVMSPKKFTQQEIRDRFDLDVPILFDSAIAASCGVYSTPQAVIIDDHQKLFYRGNYNRSRYCTNEKSNYAKMALDDLLHHNLTPVFSPYALKAYGCSLPTCNK